MTCYIHLSQASFKSVTSSLSGFLVRNTSRRFHKSLTREARFRFKHHTAAAIFYNTIAIYHRYENTNIFWTERLPKCSLAVYLHYFKRFRFTCIELVSVPRTVHFYTTYVCRKINTYNTYITLLYIESSRKSSYVHFKIPHV